MFQEDDFMKNHKKWMVLAAIMATGSTVLTVPTPVAQAQAPSGETQSDQTVALDGQSVNVNGQTFKLNGSINVRFSVQQKKDGAQIKLHFNLQGASVTAADGTVFRLVGASNTKVRTETDGATFKAGANFGLVGQGKAPNLRLRVNLKGSVRKTGQVTLTKSDLELR
jgi:hypothetical protein